MGCCQRKSETLFVRTEGKTLGFIPLEDTESISSSSLAQYVQDRYYAKDYQAIADCLHCDLCLQTTRMNIWGSSPQTVASFTAMVLGKVLSSEALPEDLLSGLVDGIASSNEDFRENCLLLLSDTMPLFDDFKVMQLITLGAFTALIRLFTCNQTELRMLAASICSQMYKKRSFAQDEFFKTRGPDLLRQLVVVEENNNLNVQQVLQCLHDLLLDESGVPRVKNCQLMQYRGTYEVLCSLSLSEKSRAVLEAVEELARLMALANN